MFRRSVIPGTRDFSTALPLITQINKARVLMLRQQEILTAEQAQRLAVATLDLEAAGPAAFRLDPEQEDPYFNYEAALIDRISADIGGRVHIARSRNDLYATMDRLRTPSATIAPVRRCWICARPCMRRQRVIAT